MRYHLPVVLIVSLISLSGCVTIFSEFQDAETMGKGNYEITPSSSIVTFNDEGSSDHIQTNIGVQAGTGISDQVDLRLRLEVPSIGDNLDTFGDFWVVGAGLKFQIYEGRLAGYVPLGLAFGEDIETSETLELQPSLIGTVPLSNSIDFNPSLKFIVPFENRDNAIALNLGVAFWNDNIGIRPEVGFMRSIEGGDGTFAHYGIGFTYRVQK